MARQKTYVFEFWRNDGRWHSGEYDLNPVLVFQADNDTDARKLVYGYMADHTHFEEDAHINGIYEIEIDVKKRKLRHREMRRSGKLSRAFEKPSAELRQRLEETKFEDLGDYVKGFLRDKDSRKKR